MEQIHYEEKTRQWIAHVCICGHPLCRGFKSKEDAIQWKQEMEEELKK